MSDIKPMSENDQIRLYTALKKLSKTNNRKIYSINCMVDSDMSEEMITGITVKFLEALKSFNWSYNIQQCDLATIFGDIVNESK